MTQTEAKAALLESARRGTSEYIQVRRELLVVALCESSTDAKQTKTDETSTVA